MRLRLLFQFAICVLCSSTLCKVAKGNVERGLLSDATPMGPVEDAPVTPSADIDPQSEEPRDLGGQAMSNPRCFSWDAGVVDCFIRSPKSTVLHMKKSADTYSDWVDIGGQIVGDVECMACWTNQILLFARGIENDLQFTEYDGRKWSDWESLGGTYREAPSCVCGKVGRVDCNVRDQDGVLVYTRSSISGTSWTPVEKTDWKFGGRVRCLRRYRIQYNCFGSITGNRFRIVSRSADGHWNDPDPKQYPELVKSEPTVCGWYYGNRTDVFVLGMNDQMLHTYVEGYSGPGWQPFEDLGGTFEDTPQCVSNDFDTIHCIGLGHDLALHRKSFVNGKWSEWILGHGKFMGSFHCLRTNYEEVSCYMRSLKNTVVEVVYALK